MPGGGQDAQLTRPFLPILSTFPSIQPAPQLHKLAAAVGKACWKDGVIGHVSVDLMAYPLQLLHAPPVMSLVPQSVQQQGQADWVFYGDAIPSDREVSVEREVFPGLLAAGELLHGMVDDSY